MNEKEASIANRETKDAWNANAAYWDQRMGEGNDFVEVLIWPPTLKFLMPKAGQHILDIACGNGLSCRKLASLGVQVTGIDFSEEMIAYARARTKEKQKLIEYHVLDATDQKGLLELGKGTFNGAICNMALFDIANINPLAQVLPILLKRGAPFVFSVMHPCFNNDGMAHVAEVEDKGGKFVTKYSVKIWKYMTSTVTPGAAMVGQPRPHLYFHRPLEELFGSFLKTGFVLDGLEERSFPKDHEKNRGKPYWNGNYNEIPPVMVARMRYYEN